MSRCKAKTLSGKRCKNKSSDGSDYCHIDSHGEDDEFVKSGEKFSDNELRSTDWQANHYLIREAYLRILKRKLSAPTIAEVAEESGFHKNTVWRHINNLDLSETVEVSGIRMLSEEVLLGVANAARKGSSANAKLFFQIVHNWSEKTDIALSGGIELGQVFPDDCD